MQHSVVDYREDFDAELAVIDSIQQDFDILDDFVNDALRLFDASRFILVRWDFKSFLDKLHYQSLIILRLTQALNCAQEIAE